MHACSEVTTGTEVLLSSTRGLWIRRLMLLLGFLIGAWLLVTLSDEGRAEAAPTPPVRPVLSSVVAPAPIPVAADVSAVLTPVTAAGSKTVDHLTASAAQVGTTVRHLSATVVTTLVRTGTDSHRLLHVPQVRHAVRGHKIRHGAPPPVSSSPRLGAVHRVVILPVASARNGLPSAPVFATTHRPSAHHASSTHHGPAPHPTPTAPTPSAPAPFAALPGSESAPHGGAQTALACSVTTSAAGRDATFVLRVAHRAPVLLSITGTPPVSPD